MTISDQYVNQDKLLSEISACIAHCSRSDPWQRLLVAATFLPEFLPYCSAESQFLPELWSLKVDLGVFHDFFAYYFGQYEQLQLRNLTSEQMRQFTQKCDSKGEEFRPDPNPCKGKS